MTPEEEAKRTVRRERNKLAAAKCRQRRVDHTNVLITVSIYFEINFYHDNVPDILVLHSF